MSIFDFVIFGLYMVGVLAVGVYHFRKNKNADDYYVGSRSVKAHHVGLSVVATDVGGGFSIGLGGVGFLMGLAGSWLLFTGLVGAWLSAVLIIPRLKQLDVQHGMRTYPDFLRYRYNAPVALVASLISGVGYLGFTGAQMLAGAKLASATILPESPLGMDPILFALLVIAAITVLYTVVGGLKAVIYTDTVQWIILLVGLIAITIPVTLHHLGGFQALREALPSSHFSLLNITPVQFVNWMVTIIPIWLIGMTLYQRIYACENEREAKKAWFIAGLFEYPVMAFTGVFLGMCARVVFPEAEPEMALPMLIRDILPVGITGIVIASYFSAIMSTADSCLMASSGNFVNDIVERYWLRNLSDRGAITLSMAATLLIGVIAVVLAAQFTTVLNAILYAYSFMVSGLFVPTLGAYFWRRGSSAGALAGMIGGGAFTILLMTNVVSLPDALGQWELDMSVYGITVSAVLYLLVSLLLPDQNVREIEQEDLPFHQVHQTAKNPQQLDIVKNVRGATIQHGPFNDRIYLMNLGQADPESLIPELLNLADDHGYGKIFAKIPESHSEAFAEVDFEIEAHVPQFYRGEENAVFLGLFLDEERKTDVNVDKLDRNLALAIERQTASPSTTEVPASEGPEVRKLTPDDIPSLAQIYEQVFPTYPFPIHSPQYLYETMTDHVDYFGMEVDGRLVAVSSAEMDLVNLNVEMTDFATLPNYRGNGFAASLLARMEKEMQKKGIRTAYTIARAASPGMNITFAKQNFTHGGRLVNNTNISGQIESMHVWYKTVGEN